MKKLFALLLVLIMPLALAACGGKEGTGSGGASKSGGKTPSPKFSGAYQYNPPKDTYFIKWQDFDAAGKEDGNADIYARIGGGCSYAEEGTSVYHASDEQQKYYERAWEGEYSDWMVSPGYGYGDWKSDREESGDDLGSCDAFEYYFMRYFRAYGFDEDEGKLAEYYVGTEKVAGVNCWVFDSKGLNAIYLKFWVDPSNGCCLKYMDTETGGSGEYSMVTEYNLNYTAWTDNLAPASSEGIE